MLTLPVKYGVCSDCQYGQEERGCASCGFEDMSFIFLCHLHVCTLGQQTVSSVERRAVGGEED